MLTFVTIINTQKNYCSTTAPRHGKPTAIFQVYRHGAVGTLQMIVTLKSHTKINNFTKIFTQLFSSVTNLKIMQRDTQKNALLHWQ